MQIGMTPGLVCEFVRITNQLGESLSTNLYVVFIRKLNSSDF